MVAAAVILPKDFKNELLNDSKKISEKNRNKLRLIIEAEATSWGIGFVSPNEIDKINILQASFLAMHRAIEKLQAKPKHLVIDGNKFNPYKKIPHTCIIKGDGKYMNIAAASILAKTHRDELMYNIHEKFPHYNWKKNKGYPTKEHREAISTHGTSPHHRMTFKLIPEQLKMKF